MTRARTRPLERLADLREREVERLAADMAERRVLRQRYLHNIERLQHLCEGSGGDGGAARPAEPRVDRLVPALSVNRGHFKQSLLQTTEAQREELVRHEAQMAAAQLSLQLAARGHEVLRRLALRGQDERRRELAGREQRGQDEIAVQCWQRTRP